MRMQEWSAILYMPAYNVQASLQELVGRLEKAKAGLAQQSVAIKSIVIVNDGSTDNTGDILSSLAKKYPYIKQISYEKNRGATDALLLAMQEALSQAKQTNLPPERTLLIRMDCDLEHQPEDLPSLLQPILAGEADACVGSIPIDKRNGFLFSLFSKMTGSWESKKFLRMEIPQFCPGFNAFRADSFAALYPQLVQTAADFKGKTGKPMLTIDFIILYLAKGNGLRISAIKLAKIEDKWIKRQPMQKLGSYLSYHFATEKFLSSGNFLKA